ncbi:Acetyl-CoA decarbonylase/synthase complex subunit alpha 1 [Dissostichus eleginoides]|uniref:Acetyl-CoA decarbonylase/synthase complex subunit alpha 1 n=1 Tax=Dissostichus eleginoides TaxID=100907 RepID=A0AAD9CGL7_DISEL|nr:Acetyl-CoA decarbonylase/synthase complex subunit alpha 1 [Dissostichus eleginoides]
MFVMSCDCLTPNGLQFPQTLINTAIGDYHRLSVVGSKVSTEITRVLTEEYPKMKNLTGGGSGQRTISVVAQGSEGYTAKMLKSNTINGKHPLYIVPLQEKFDTTPLPPDAAEFCKMPKSQCKSCGKTLPLQLLVIHIETCGHNSSRKVRWRNNMKLMLKIKSSVPVQFVVTSILQISCPIMPVHVVKVHLRIYQVHQAVQTELDHIAVRKNMTAFQLLTLMLREWAWTHMKRQQPSSKDIFCGKMRWNPQSGQAWTSGRTKNPKVGKYLPSTKAHKLTGHALYGVLYKLDGDELLSDQQTNEINNLAFSWDLPAIKPANRRWLFQQLMQHAVIGRRTKQIKQIRKGLKDTKVWTLLKEKPETARIVFPRQANAFPTAQLTKFWVGWEIPTDTLKVRVVKGAYLKSSTCFGTLHVPGHFQNYEDFSKHVESCIATYVTGFGLV